MRGRDCPGTAGFEARDWRELDKVELGVLQIYRNRTHQPAGAAGKK
jgi:hypothetical protein